jgi:hypothetical protein
MEHSYTLRGGKLKALLARNTMVNIAFSFAVWDKKSKTALVCTYTSLFADAKSEKQWRQAILDNNESFSVLGVGRSNPPPQPTRLSKELDFKALTQGSGSLSIAAEKDSSDLMIATITLDAGHVMLPFPIVAFLSDNVPRNSRGVIGGGIRKFREVPTVGEVETELVKA